jgi:hypothetical protein
MKIILTAIRSLAQFLSQNSAANLGPKFHVLNSLKPIVLVDKVFQRLAGYEMADIVQQDP